MRIPLGLRNAADDAGADHPREPDWEFLPDLNKALLSVRVGSHVFWRAFSHVVLPVRGLWFGAPLSFEFVCSSTF